MSDHAPLPPLTPALDLLLDELAERIATRLHDQLPSWPGTADEPRSPWMNITSAAAYLDLPKARLYRLSASGGVPHFKQGGRVLFHRRELDHWLAQHAQGERRTPPVESELC